MSDVHCQVGDLTQFTPGNEVAAAQLHARIKQLEDCLLGISSCSTCEACRGAAEKTLRGDKL